MDVWNTLCHIDEPVSSSSVLLALAEAVAARVNLPTEAPWLLLTFCQQLSLSVCPQKSRTGVLQ